MAPVTTELSTLKALTFRISSTPTPQLPQHVPAIAAALANCRTLLSSTQASGAKASSSEASVAIHKYRTLISTLLQDRTVQGRWCAIVLVKATIEVGGWETLQKSLPWVRGLLGFLNKPDPPSSKKLCVITLTRIFLLTREYPTLIREITTPSLPAFVQVTLQLANSTTSSSLLQTILESFNILLPRHPTIFRSYLKQIQPLLAHLIAPTPSSKISQEQSSGLRAGITSEIVSAARRIYVQIPSCAPKGASSEEWGKSVKSTINKVHKTADKVFRAVLEDWQSSGREAPTPNGHTLDDDVQDLESDGANLPPWSGIFAGSERLTGLLHVLKQYLESPTASSVYLNVGMIMDLVTRMLSLTVPAVGGKSFQNVVRLNNQASKEERENLWLLLPDVHVASVEVLLALAHRSQASTLALDSAIIDQVVWVFGSEKGNGQIRTACYSVIGTLLERSGLALHKTTIDSLVPLVRACCDDLLPSEPINGPAKQTPGQAKANGNSQPQTTSNADTFLGSSKGVADSNAGLIGLKEAAYGLLPVLLTNISAQYFSDSLRARLDRTAILIQHKDAMVASVLNPPPSKKFGKAAASILPLMARSFPKERDVEGMLRPRMPVIRLGGQDLEMEEEADDMEIEEEDEEDAEEADAEPAALEQPDESFVGHELDHLLESARRVQHVADETATPNIPHSKSSHIPAHERNSGWNTSPQKSDVVVPEPSQFSDTAKRYLGDGAVLSPSKRVKANEDVSDATTDTVSGIAQSGEPVAGSFVPATSDFTVTSTASTVPELPEPSDADSDDDEIIPLVFGQDTDDESD
ncbi:hypothetical protein T440DRAFT_268347 [Plenodomus tracheiphilus IPT5]|uniref:Pre-rRNA-processing protein RIX1 n=1 Tax=Plenodomus tracheiphilus IPT5 TaxID=1408161 RepID=A0A6A7BFH2_9PLEO|nr:hypothetical protein T440DRAFT_268347 [Plenodomus tracheiphilus IPT5]